MRTSPVWLFECVDVICGYYFVFLSSLRNIEVIGIRKCLLPWSLTSNRPITTYNVYKFVFSLYSDAHKHTRICTHIINDDLHFGINKNNNNEKKTIGQMVVRVPDYRVAFII